jgi:site-specific DNA-cytosine methylase
MNHLHTDRREIRHFHMFSGIGGGAKGFNMGFARVGAMESVSRCIGGVDVDAAAIRDFDRQTGIRGTVLDMFDRDQYKAFHGSEPPPAWTEATPADIQRAAGNERPHVVFLSAPCKGFSGLLARSLSVTNKYQALNRLTLRGVWLMLEAWADDPPELIVFENVPLIKNRGRHLLDQIIAMLQQYGYAVAETTHDCGELGALAQSRKRFLMVARHTAKVPPFLYEPEKKSLRSVGELLDRMPLPGDAAGGPMHRVPKLQFQTWTRLAFVEAGSDWRSLQRLNVQDGVLTDFTIVPDGAPHRGYLGVQPWSEASGAVCGGSRPGNGAFSVADPRFNGKDYCQYGVIPYRDSMGAISAQSMPGGGKYAIADPRVDGAPHMNAWRIVRYADAGGAVSGSGKASGGGALADPRHGGPEKHSNEYRVAVWDRAAQAVTSAHGTGQCIADPRGIIQTERPVPVPDVHAPMPGAREHMVARIRALDGTWHRPFTTLELAVLQSLIEPEEYLELDGLSDQAWRERIGNMVPPLAAREIANVMFTTLLLAWSGETFVLSSQKIWVRDIALALTVSHDGR